MEHTKGPWVVRSFSWDGSVTIYSPSESFGEPDLLICSMPDAPGALANARHIVKCVNSHDRMVEALKNALWYIKQDMGDEGVQAHALGCNGECILCDVFNALAEEE